MTTTYIIYGPQGSGKTRFSDVLKKFFECEHLVDGWDGRTALEPGTLALTNVEPSQWRWEPALADHRVYSMPLSHAIKRLGVGFAAWAKDNSAAAFGIVQTAFPDVARLARELED